MSFSRAALPVAVVSVAVAAILQLVVIERDRSLPVLPSQEAVKHLGSEAPQI